MQLFRGREIHGKGNNVSFTTVVSTVTDYNSTVDRIGKPIGGGGDKAIQKNPSFSACCLAMLDTNKEAS